MFTTDRKGDQDNLKYGSIDKYKVPKYRTAGSGGLLGLSRVYRISSSTESDRVVDDLSLDSTRKGRQNLVAQDISDFDNNLSRDYSNPSDSTFIHQEDFIRFNQTHERLSQSLSSSLTDNVDDHPWLGGESADSHNSRAGKSLIIEKNLESVPKDAFDQFKNHVANKKQQELIKYTEDDPHDLSLWQALIQHQEDYYRLTSGVSRLHLTAFEQQTVSQIRLDLYQKALIKMTDASSREQLLMGMMLEGTRIWDTNTQMKEWTRILQKTDCFSLRVGYLDFIQQNSIIYTYERCLDAYIEEFRQVENSADSIRKMTYLTLRLTNVMRAAGYVERALAIWQALMEINFSKPANIERGNVKAAFREFWESEVPRLGEHGAAGWSEESAVEKSPQADPLQPQIQTSQIFDMWSREEDSLENNCIAPARTLDETAENDPYRVVLFSDIEDFVFEAKTSADKEALLIAFMRFCGLPAPSTAAKHNLLWWKDPNLSHCQQNVWDYMEHNADDLGYGLPRYIRTDSLSLLGDKSVNGGFSRNIQISNTNIVDFALKVLVQVVESRQLDDVLAEYLIILKYNFNQSSGLKYSKNLLKKYSNHPRLYNTYATLQATDGKLENAYKVWSTAISMAASFEEVNDRRRQDSVVLLLHDWIWQLVKNKFYTHAMALLIKGFQNEKIHTQVAMMASNNSIDFSEEEVFRAKHHLNTSVVSSLSRDGNSSIIWYTNLSVILSYLTSDCSLDEALRAYDSTLAGLTEDQYDNVGEYIHQWRARFLDLHVKQSPSGYRPAQVTAIVKESFDVFPQNSMFHDLYDQLRRRSGLVDRLRLFNQSPRIPHLQQGQQRQQQQLGQKSQNQTRDRSSTPPTDMLPIPNIAPDILTISAELSRPLYAGSTPHSIRAAFVKATGSDGVNSSVTPAGKYSPLIWQIWLEWELRFFTKNSDMIEQQQQLRQSFDNNNYPTNEINQIIDNKGMKNKSSSPSSDNQFVIRSPPGIATTTTTTITTTTIATSKDLKRLKEIYLSALRACPGVKALYMIGFTHGTMRQALGHQGMVDVYRSMVDRGLRIRIDIEDLLESMEK